jgi:propanol-preferring alcohol dehydrogenase
MMDGNMRAMVLHDWVKKWGNNLKLEYVPIPKVGSKEALVRVKACGVGLTVYNFLIGESSTDRKLLPRIPGHEIAGDVVQVGEGVGNVGVGDRVLVYFYLSCGNCSFCLGGMQDLCTNLLGVVGVQCDGGYAEYVKVPADNLIRFPESIPYAEATVINDAVATPVHVMKRRAEVRPGHNVMVIGAAGGVGIHMVQMARVFGGNVIGIDVDDEKLKKVQELGADVVINARRQSVVEEVKRATGGKGVESAIDMVGSRETLASCLESVARQGRVVTLTGHPGVTVEVSPRRLVHDEIAFLGSRYTTKTEFMEAIEFVRSGKVRPVVSESRPLERVEELHIKLSENRLLGRGVVIP